MPPEPSELAEGWNRQAPASIAIVNALLKERHIDHEEIATQTFVSDLDTLERIDRMIMQAEGRRMSVLREIERHRGALAQRLRETAGKIEEAEFREIPEGEGLMKASPRTLANRRNARFSTGPKTLAGKARVAKNAFRHGLATPISSDIALSESAQRLTIAIAGKGANEICLERAERIADAQVDLQRIRRGRRGLLADFSEACLTPRRAVPKMPRVRDLIHMIRQLNGGGELDARARDVLRRLADIASAASLRSHQQPAVLAKQLVRLDRYERRALSRLKRASRDFDALE